MNSLSIKEQFGEDVVAIGGMITPTRQTLFTLRKSGNKTIKKLEYDIQYDPSLKDLCKEMGIKWYPKQKGYTFFRKR